MEKTILIRNATKLQLADMYWEKGMSLRDISNEFNCSKGTVKGKLNEYKIPVRSRIDALRMPRSLVKKSKAMIIAYRNPALRASKGEISKQNWGKPRFRRKRANSMAKVWANPEYRAKRAKTLASPEFRTKVSNTSKIMWSNYTPEKRATISKSMTNAGKQRWANPEFRAKMIGTHNTPEFKAKQSQKSKQVWANYTPEKRNALIRSSRKSTSQKPTKPEMQMIDLLNASFPNEWRYVGNGKVIINGKIPDFININGKKQIIEVFGNYWHGQIRTGRLSEEETENRIQSFAEYGFDTLIIWENELENQVKVLAKITEFTEKEKIA